MEVLREGWVKATNSLRDGLHFEQKVLQAYKKWLGIVPSKDIREAKELQGLGDAWVPGASSSFESPGGLAIHAGAAIGWSAEYGPWSMLNASAMFTLYHKTSYKLVWYVAGRQLAMMKAQAVSCSRSYPTTNTAPVFVVPPMYAIMKPNRTLTQRWTALRGAGNDDESMAALHEVMDFNDDGSVIDDV